MRRRRHRHIPLHERPLPAPRPAEMRAADQERLRWALMALDIAGAEACVALSYELRLHA